MTIIVCIPGSNFSGNFLECWSEFLKRGTIEGINLRLSHSEDAVVYYARNKALGGNVLSGIHQKPFGGAIDYDYLLWIDSDIIFSYDHFKKLLAWDMDIVSGLYLMKGGRQFATVVDWDVEFFKKNGYFQFLTPADVKSKTGLIDVAYTGFGFMLVKYGVFESLLYPWFRPEWQDMGGEVQDFSSEDVSFCQTIRKKGYKIFVDPAVVVGHEKRVVLLP